ncbi:MAG: hypothetical protein KGM99_19155, partial [Burkholderiales bacterium]|nr:hypothetical protein [Burkholderiales bacterium]
LLHGHAMYSSGTDLFQWCSHHDLDAQSEQLWQFMAQRGIWLRWFAAGAFRPHGVRFGLPATESAWQQLEHALTEWKAQHA